MMRGFTLVEVVVAATLLLIVSMGVYSAYEKISNSIYGSHLKLAAADLINEEFEIIRNLPYTDVGIVGGNPLGKIPASQMITKGNITWNVDVDMRNVDDPFDGVSPADTKPNDYKLVEVQVSCSVCTTFFPVTVTGLVAPRNLEP